MKKLVTIFLFMLLVTGCSGEKLENINYKELQQKVNNQDSFILYVGESEDLENTLNKVLISNNLNAYKLDVKKLTTDEIDTLRLTIDYQEPSIIFILQGKDPSILSHITNTSITEKEIENRLIDMKFIK